MSNLRRALFVENISVGVSAPRVGWLHVLPALAARPFGFARAVAIAPVCCCLPVLAGLQRLLTHYAGFLGDLGWRGCSYLHVEAVSACEAVNMLNCNG